ncbi:flippase [Marinithermus hydrothermalis]|uniref:Polysaccharide biosynthesis protein n=1 Tax=Marinithermus hydrothermalis (strain DSM 14884 / JCM 11576 / T1) TaxID=869210 RepID=F2NQY4_MARHT|nr:flippase [Marinithermus hydrothermalis]AEB12562.1 polysaccharide biosynthesis protein [Marinithermus hydrothermalis DSM 14884]
MLKALPRFLTRLKQQDMLATLARGAGIAFVLQASGTGLKYLTQVLLARWMGAAEYGVYAYAFTWANLLSVLATLGFTTGSLRFVPEYLAKEDWAHLRGFIRRVRQLVLLAGLLLAAVGGGILILLHSPQMNTTALLLGMALVPLLALVSVQREMVRGTRRIALAYAPPMVLQPVLVLVAAFLMLSSLGGLTGVAALSAFALALLIVLGVQGWGLVQTLPQEAVSMPPRYETARWWRVSFPLLLVSGSLIVLNQADILMIGIFLGPKEAGIYMAATKTAALVSFVLVAVNAIVAPMISELHTKGDREELQRMVSAAVRWMFWPSLSVTLGLLLLGRVVLGLFGTEFPMGYSALVLLALGQLVNASVGPVGYLMSLTGHQDLSAWVYGLSALVNIGLNALLIPIWGLIGAALATMAAMVLWNAWLYVLVYRFLGLDVFFLSFR